MANDTTPLWPCTAVFSYYFIISSPRKGGKVVVALHYCLITGRFQIGGGGWFGEIGDGRWHGGGGELRLLLMILRTLTSGG